MYHSVCAVLRCRKLPVGTPRRWMPSCLKGACGANYVMFAWIWSHERPPVFVGLGFCIDLFSFFIFRASNSAPEGTCRVQASRYLLSNGALAFGRHFLLFLLFPVKPDQPRLFMPYRLHPCWSMSVGPFTPEPKRGRQPLPVFTWHSRAQGVWFRRIKCFFLLRVSDLVESNTRGVWWIFIRRHENEMTPWKNSEKALRWEIHFHIMRHSFRWLM